MSACDMTTQQMDDAMNIVLTVLDCFKHEDKFLHSYFELTIPGGQCKCGCTYKECKINYLVMHVGGSIEEDLNTKENKFRNCPACGEERSESIDNIPQFLIVRCNKEEEVEVNLNCHFFENYVLVSLITSDGVHAITYASYDDKWYEFDDQYVTEVTTNQVENFRCVLGMVFKREEI